MGIAGAKLPFSSVVRPKELSDASRSEPPPLFVAEGSMEHSDGTSRSACLDEEICIDEYMCCGIVEPQKSFLANI